MMEVFRRPVEEYQVDFTREENKFLEKWIIAFLKEGTSRDVYKQGSPLLLYLALSSLFISNSEE